MEAKFNHYLRLRLAFHLNLHCLAIKDLLIWTFVSSQVINPDFVPINDNPWWYMRRRHRFQSILLWTRFLLCIFLRMVVNYMQYIDKLLEKRRCKFMHTPIKIAWISNPQLCTGLWKPTIPCKTNSKVLLIYPCLVAFSFTEVIIS